MKHLSNYWNFYTKMNEQAQGGVPRWFKRNYYKKSGERKFGLDPKDMDTIYDVVKKLGDFESVIALQEFLWKELKKNKDFEEALNKYRKENGKEAIEEDKFCDGLYGSQTQRVVAAVAAMKKVKLNGDQKNLVDELIEPLESIMKKHREGIADPNEQELDQSEPKKYDEIEDEDQKAEREAKETEKRVKNAEETIGDKAKEEAQKKAASKFKKGDVDNRSDVEKSYQLKKEVKGMLTDLKSKGVKMDNFDEEVLSSAGTSARFVIKDKSQQGITKDLFNKDGGIDKIDNYFKMFGFVRLKAEEGEPGGENDLKSKRYGLKLVWRKQKQAPKQQAPKQQAKPAEPNPPVRGRQNSAPAQAPKKAQEPIAGGGDESKDRA